MDQHELSSLERPARANGARESEWSRRLAWRVSNNLPDLVGFAIAVAAAVVIAGILFANYYSAPDLLWRNFHHDRNSHFSFGLDLALALRQFDPVWFFSELDKAKVWPPVHGLVLSAVLAVGGIDYRLAILPSLIGWVMTIALVWLVARRLFSERITGLFAAAIAAVLTAASPAFRLISADVMLEGLGAGLSALALWAYLRAFAQPDDRARWRLLAIVLTVLFFHKGNYWGLMVAALAVSFASEHARRTFDLIRTTLAKIKITASIRRAVRDPLLLLFALLVAVVGYLYWRGPTALMLFGRPVSFYPPENLTTAAYAVLFVWSALLWRRHRAAIDEALGCAGRALLYWHVMPIAISFLLPRRLSRFLWFVGPANNPNGPLDLPQAIRFYWDAFADGFHVAPWVAILAVALAAIGATRIRTLTPGARAVFILAALAFAGVVIHPQHQGRFLSSWVFAVWICAGAGAGVVLSGLLRRYSRSLRSVAAIALVALLAATTAWYRTPAAAYAHSLHPISGPTDLDLVRPYLAELDGAREVGFVTTFGVSKLFSWVLSERCRCRVLIEDLQIDHTHSRQEARDLMAERIGRARARIFVTIDAPGERYSLAEMGWVYPSMVGILDAMAAQTRYVRGNSYELPGHDARATIWHLR
ncbi:MAG: glycosyltransferase family 39 protein [Rhodopseudomonas sp.]|uniref:glycosyltransferase family 39 protein n=1 Tax=Rhodopseudomonas sp. TaxID=1078 RepID=UPI0017D220BD|nr:glycosyltransferase family 39 protein [Rhodopseudomonas sp.]NVN88562.1 glycosyltransferase family 39 protein [Rhodopseudomonas sp.]